MKFYALTETIVTLNYYVLLQINVASERFGPSVKMGQAQ